MRHFFEMYLTSNGNWEESSVMYNARRRSGKKRCGKYVWKRLMDLKQQCLAPNFNLYMIIIYIYM